jgi:DNA-binding CsgD family transcriptional regulator
MQRLTMREREIAMLVCTGRPWPHQYAAIAASQLIPGRYAV